MEDLLLSFNTEAKTESEQRFRVPFVLRNAAVLLLAFGIGVAAAAYSDDVPGDRFYRAKRVAEQPARIVDRDLIANNRLGELEELIDRGADPATVLTARTDAERALLSGRADDGMAQAFSLLAWPGGLHGRGVDAEATNDGLVIAESEWFNEQGYTAALTDGHLVTISAVDGEILIATTGRWTVSTTATGWQLTTEGIAQTYLIQRQGRDLRVNSEGRNAAPGTLEALGSIGAPTLAGRSRSDGPIGGFDGLDRVPSRSSGSNGTAAGGDGEPATPTTRFRGATTAGEAGSGPFGSGASGSGPAPAPPGSTTPTTGAPSAPAASAPVGPRTTAPTPPSTSHTPTTGGATTAPPAPSTSRPPATTSPPAPSTSPPTTRATTTTTRPTTTAAPPPPVWNLYLLNPGTGNSSSSRTLTMAPGPVPGGSLANYDTDRDDEPGLLIKKDGGGLSVSDSTKSQIWTWTNPQPTSFNGSAEFTIWLAAKDFEDDERIGVLASLELCNPGCTRLGTGQWSRGGGDDDDDEHFVRATIGFGTVQATVPAGSTLRLKVVVPDQLASTDVLLAYDSAATPSRLTIG